jgi:hypothetical protein
MDSSMIFSIIFYSLAPGCLLDAFDSNLLGRWERLSSRDPLNVMEPIRGWKAAPTVKIH